MRILTLDRQFRHDADVMPLGHILHVKARLDDPNEVTTVEVVLIDIQHYHLFNGESVNGQNHLNVRYCAVPTSDLLFAPKDHGSHDEDVEVFVAQFDAKTYYKQRESRRWGVGKVFTKDNKTLRVTSINSIYFKPDTDPDNPIVVLEFLTIPVNLPSKKFIKHQQAANRIQNFRLL